MKREVAVSIVVIALLIVGGLILFTNQSNMLTDTRATVTAQADVLDTQAADSAQVASAATQAADTSASAAIAAAETQSAILSSMATNEANAQDAGTQASENEAALVEEAEATRAALEDDLATNQAAADEVQGELSTRQAEATELHLTATEYVILRVEAATQAAATASSLEQQADALEAQVGELGELATQSVAVSANQSAMVLQAATVQAESEATISVLEDNLATALAQPPVTAPTQDVTPAPTTVITSNAVPVAPVAVGGLTYDEAFNQDTVWSLGAVEGAGTMALADGQYVVTVDVSPSVLTVFTPPQVMDGYAEVEVFLDDCPQDGFFGLLSRVQPLGEGGYLFLLPCNLSFWAIVVFPTDGQPSVLASDALPPPTPAESHTIGVLTDDDSLSLYFDGQLLGSTTDSTFLAGMIGIYAESVSAEAVLRADNYRVWELR